MQNEIIHNLQRKYFRAFALSTLPQGSTSILRINTNRCLFRFHSWVTVHNFQRYNIAIVSSTYPQSTSTPLRRRIEILSLKKF